MSHSLTHSSELGIPGIERAGDSSSFSGEFFIVHRKAGDSSFFNGRFFLVRGKTGESFSFGGGLFFVRGIYYRKHKSKGKTPLRLPPHTKVHKLFRQHQDILSSDGFSIENLPITIINLLCEIGFMGGIFAVFHLSILTLTDVFIPLAKQVVFKMY